MGNSILFPSISGDVCRIPFSQVKGAKTIREMIHSVFDDYVSTPVNPVTELF